ncbi:hypothetical protein QBC39DRAFT_370551 [Podospora conica]|nr:hypothetical protein QBC39DRAFT_370551 [Schizothecium conicum]
MNTDELMSDVHDANPDSNDPSTSGYAAAAKNTPSGSGDDDPTWNTKKFRDECTSLKSRMLDPSFSFQELPDPLLSRQPPLRKPLSDKSAETIRRLRVLVEAIRAGQVSG